MKSENRNSLISVPSTVVLAIGCGAGPDGATPHRQLSSPDRNELDLARLRRAVRLLSRAADEILLASRT